MDLCCPATRRVEWRAMGSLLVMLLLSPRRLATPKPTLGSVATPKKKSDDAALENLKAQARRVARAAAGEALGGLLALLCVVSAVLFFYLFCLP